MHSPFSKVYCKNSERLTPHRKNYRQYFVKVPPRETLGRLVFYDVYKKIKKEGEGVVTLCSFWYQPMTRMKPFKLCRSTKWWPPKDKIQYSAALTAGNLFKRLHEYIPSRRLYLSCLFIRNRAVRCLPSRGKARAQTSVQGLLANGGRLRAAKQRRQNRRRGAVSGGHSCVV